MTPGARTYQGSAKAPMPELPGVVARLLNSGPPIKLDESKTPATLPKVWYKGVVMHGGLVEPKEGGVEEASIGGMTVNLKSKDIGKGVLTTEEFGDIRLLFKEPFGFYLVMNAAQLRTLAERAK